MKFHMILNVLAILIPVFGSPLIYESNDSNRDPPTVEPEFCHKLECPKYTRVEKHADYELRSYFKSTWVATNITTMTFTEDDERELFDRLFHYISGNNTKNMKIAMTAPVLRTILHGQGPDCESTFTTHFMVPFELEAQPPVPTDTKVKIVTLPAIKVYVRSYGGYSNGTAIQTNLQQLADDIGDAGKYMTNPYYAAGYDSPYQVLNRHNEVWLEEAGQA